MPKPSAIDRWFFMNDGPGVPTHVAALVTLKLPDDAPPDFVRRLADDMRAAQTFGAPFNYRLRRPKLRRVAPSFEVLPDESIDLDYHFRHSALPAPGGERELGVLVARMFSRPLDPTKPLWEVHLIEGLENGRFAWFFKVHHGLMDGVGGMRRFAQMLTADPSATELRPIWTIKPKESTRPRLRDAEKRQRALANLKEGLGASGALSKAIGETVKEGFRHADPAWAVPYDAPMSIINRRITAQRRFATQSYDLDRILTVAKGFGVSVNDVFLALCSGALRRYLVELGELPDKSLQVGIPVNIRDVGDETSSNAISAILVKLRTDLEDPVERINAIAESSRLAKDKLKALPKAAGDLFGVVALGPMSVGQMIGINGRTRPTFNLLVSNVPGPPAKLYMRGAELEGLWPLSILSHGQALNISAGSMAGKFHIGFLGCRDTLPHLQRLALHTAATLEELEKALAVPDGRAPKRTARKPRPRAVPK